jgi:hypothetical protein
MWDIFCSCEDTGAVAVKVGSSQRELDREVLWVEELPDPVGITVKVDMALCLGDPLGEFCPEDVAELLDAEGCFKREGEEDVDEEEAESMANFVQSAH